MIYTLRMLDHELSKNIVTAVKHRFCLTSNDQFACVVHAKSIWMRGIIKTALKATQLTPMNKNIKALDFWNNPKYYIQLEDFPEIADDHGCFFALIIHPISNTPGRLYHITTEGLIGSYAIIKFFIV